jgi:hypothetical protein
MLGFENILVVFNDCTDHSPQLLRVLEKAGVLNCKRHRPEPGMMRLRLFMLCQLRCQHVPKRGVDTTEELAPACVPDRT